MESNRYRYVRKRKQTSGAGGFLRALVLVIVFGATAYLLFGTGVIKRVKENWSLSLLDRISGKASSALPPSSVHAEPIGEPAPEPTGETAEIKLPAIEICMLQTGVFDSAESASAAAERLKSMGAADYLYEDSGSFRLIAAAYSDEASAESVRERLAGEGMECSVFKLSRKEVDLIVTAAQNRLLPIRTAFGLAYDLTEQLGELAIEFDAEAREIDYGVKVLSEISVNIASASEGIRGMTEQNAMLGKVSEYYADLAALVNEASGKVSSRTEFASALKTLRIKAAIRYSELLENIGK